MSLNLKISTIASDQFKELVAETIWGIEGKTRYTHKNTGHKIDDLTNPYFIYLMRNDRLLGAVNLNQRDFQMNGKPIHSLYIRYFSFLHQLQSGSLGRKKSGSGGPIKKQLHDLFNNGEIGKGSKNPLFYAYIELENERSARVCKEFGFVPIRELVTTIFSRFTPKLNKNVRLIHDSEKDEIRYSIKKFYSEHIMYHDQKLFKRGDYFVYEENGKIIAGLQATPIQWEIVELPGISGKIMMNILPYIPIISRVFTPKDYRFLSFDQIFYKQGHEKKLELLMESALALSNHYTGMIWTDRQCKVYHALKNRVYKGLVNKLKNEVPGNVIARFSKEETPEIKELSNYPVYICTYDLT